MAKHVSLIFSGPDRDESGLPRPFHRYEIYLAKWEGGGVATVLVSTIGSPSPDPLSFVSPKGRKHALKLAANALVQLHPGLARHHG
jgi:hypothetical protein